MNELNAEIFRKMCRGKASGSNIKAGTLEASYFYSFHINPAQETMNRKLFDQVNLLQSKALVDVTLEMLLLKSVSFSTAVQVADLSLTRVCNFFPSLRHINGNFLVPI